MAIRRCPYCKAIIDEKDKYCDNCGTQLLFPEDEYEEEPIPGDKIVDEEKESEEGKSEKDILEEEGETGDEEDNDEEIEETEDEDELEAAAEEEEEEESGELNKFAGSEKEEEEIHEEELDYGGEDKGEFGEPLQEEREGESAERTPTGLIAEEEEKDERELQSWMALKEEIAKKTQAERQDTTPRESVKDLKEEIPATIQDPDKKYKVSIEADELVFKTKELEQITQTVEEGKKDLEKLLSSYEEKKEEKEEEHPSETKDELPPWVSGMKEAPPSMTPDLEKEVDEERGPVRQEWAVDSGIGIPERVTQTTTSFTETMAREEEKQEEQERESIEEVAREEVTPHARAFALKMKAKCVDLIFITALWLISLAFAAGVIGVSFFKIILVAPLPVLAFYLLLLLLYFFLFLYFLGETLGDHYFSAED
jgi:hypothetical protein